MGSQDSLTRAAEATRRQIMIGTGVAICGLATGLSDAHAATKSGISRNAESIHQEITFKASPARIYSALTEGEQFHKIALLSGVMQSLGAKALPTDLKAEAGSAFTLFGGYIVGRQIELTPNERIVQAWRSQSWKPGDYSIAKFELIELASGTKIVFDHRGFPNGTADHLASGWKEHYWDPLAKFLA